MVQRLYHLVLLAGSSTLACSDFYMPTSNGSNFRISVRTMDLGVDGGWNVTTVPKGLTRSQKQVPTTGSALEWTSLYGYVGFAAPKAGFPTDGAVGEALSEVGLVMHFEG